MTKQSVGGEETIIARVRADYRENSDKTTAWGHYETVSMSTITRVAVGEEVAVKVNEKDGTGDYIGEDDGDEVLRFTGFKL